MRSSQHIAALLAAASFRATPAGATADDGQCAAGDSSASCGSAAGILDTVTANLGCSKGDVPKSELERLDCVLDSLFDAGNKVDFLSDGDLGNAGTYGEVSAAGARLMEELVGSEYTGLVGLSSDDVFVDVGSGTGRLPAQYYLGSTVKAAYGIELLHTRCAYAQKAAQQLSEFLGAELSELKPLPSGPAAGSPGASTLLRDSAGRSLGMLCGDALALEDPDSPLQLKDVTVFFMNSLCFPEYVMVPVQDMIVRQLQPGALVLSSASLLGCHRGLVEAGALNLKDTRSIPALFHVYVVAPPLGLPASAFASEAGLPVLRAALNNLPDLRLTRLQRSYAAALRGGKLTVGTTPRAADTAEKRKRRGSIFLSHRQLGQKGNAQVCVFEDFLLRQTLAGPDALMDFDSILRGEAGGPVDEAHLADVTRDYAGETLYHKAVAMRSPALLRALRRSGAPPDARAKDAGGQTLCHREVIAKALRHETPIRKLEGEAFEHRPAGSLLAMLVEEFGVDCSSLDRKKRFPLHYAAIDASEASVSYLLGAGRAPAVVEELRAEDRDGSRPLHLARTAAVARLLLAAKADPQARDRAGLRALEVAKAEKQSEARDELVSVLTEAGS